MIVLPIFTRTWLLDCIYPSVRAVKAKLVDMEKGYYWNDNIRLLIEMYFELMLVSLIRVYTREDDVKYEIFITVLSITTAVAMLAFFFKSLDIALSYKSMTKHEEIEETVGTIFEDLDERISLNYLFTPIFLLGRICFCYVLIFMQERPWLQVMLITWLSLWVTIFITHVKPFVNPMINATEFIN
jgi:hypothetical protein